MLSVAAISNVGAAASYFAKDNYYTRDTEAPSAWWGKAAEALGLLGQVDAPTFEAMLSGKLPNGIELGTTRDGEWQHKPGWDLTFSAPKSVSLIALVAGDAKLLAAHDSAVQAAMAHVEATLIHTRVRDGAEVHLVPTDNLAAALFRHDVNRNQEPQLHTHAIVMNATQTEDGQWRSIESRPIMQQIKAVGEIYRSFLAAEVRRLGYEIVPGKDATFEIAGIDPALLDRMSSRSTAIEERLADRGLTRETATTSQKTEAALSTRPRKEAVDRTSLRDEWQVRIEGQLPELAALVTKAQSHAQSPGQFEERQTVAGLAAIDKAIAHLAEREQAFSRERLVQTAVHFSIGSADPAAIDRAIATRVAEQGLIPKQVIEPSPETRSDVTRDGFTTPGAIRDEHALFGLLGRAHGAGRPLASAPVAAAAVSAAERHAEARNLGWNEAQRAAALGIMRSRDRVVLLQGWAGTAKTSTVIATVAGAAAAAGYDVQALAPSASAAQTLGQALRTDGQTVHRFLMTLEREDARPKTLVQRVASLLSTPKQLWIVDEMSLLGVNKTVELLAAAERHGAKVLLTGDRLQLGSVEAGKAFDQALDRSVETFRLTDIVRQTTETGKAAVTAMIGRQAGAALELLERDGGSIVQAHDAEDRTKAIAEHYVGLSQAARRNTILIDPSREGGEAIKATVRSLLKTNGELTGPAAPGLRLLDAGMSNVEKTIASSYTGSEIIRAGRTIEGADGTLAKGEYAFVRDVIAGREQIRVQKEDGHVVTLNTRDFDPRRLDVFQPAPGELQKGDLVRWARNDQKLQLARGDIGTVTNVGGTEVTIAFEKGVTRQLDVKNNRAHQHYDYAYAVTAYGAQGMTKNWVLHAESWRINLINWRSMYVGVSRGESSGTIVTDDVARLRQAITGRAGEKTVAIDSDLIGRVQQAAGEALRAQGMAQTSAPASVSPDEALHRASAQDRMARMQAARDSPTVGPTTSHQQPAGRGTLEQGLTLE
jgi:conjugative relaxase-like TrwC/TraI family protein